MILDWIKNLFSKMCAGSDYYSTYVGPPDLPYGEERKRTIKSIEDSVSTPLYGDRKIKHEETCKQIQKDHGYGLTEYGFKSKYAERMNKY